MPESLLPPRSGEEPDVAAGELALGLLTGDERAAALRRVAADPAFAGEVEAWRHRLVALLDGVGALAPPETIWPRIVAGLDQGRSSVLPWRIATFVALAAAACLALLLLARPPEAPPLPAPRTETIIAQLSNKGGESLLAAQYDAAAAVLRVRTDHLTHDHLSPELWVIAKDAKPRSLGLVAPGGTSEVAVSEAIRGYIAEGATLALTYEPRTGAPHAAPTGDILASAKLVRL